MKKILFLLGAPLLPSCGGYEKVTLTEETPFYRNLRPVEDPVATIPANTEVIIAGKGDNKRIIYNDQKGYIVQASYTSSPQNQKNVAAQK
ncbi:hypothetical protein [Flavobacterium cyanobacteriorum]|nr:hypothetical protein [Flavobacterium cyanobacteriorum]